jgi:hypothetical protein
MLNAFIDAHEGRFVATVDIKGAFLKAKVPDDMELMVKMTGELVQLMCDIDTSLNRDQRGVLYLKHIKALYGHIEAARLFYDDLDHTIQKVLMFKQNQYDPCVQQRGETKYDYNKDSCRRFEYLFKVKRKNRRSYK